MASKRNTTTDHDDIRRRAEEHDGKPASVRGTENSTFLEHVSTLHVRVTIVVATHNRRKQLQASLPRHLVLPERPPVIVVDNASTDATAEGLDGVTVIRLERNRGGAGRNVGVEAARTPYVAFSDDDAWWEPGALDLAADLLDAHPRLALVQAQILVGPEERLDPELCRDGVLAAPRGRRATRSPAAVVRGLRRRRAALGLS